MTIRKYKAADRAACIHIFKSNCPAFFDESELDAFAVWLNGQDTGEIAYSNSSAELYYVLEHEQEILGCGGFYIEKDKPSARMAWGMVHNASHKKGYGRKLFEFRLNEIKQRYPGCSTELDTSQHTYGFFERFGFSVTKITTDGYGPGLHRYDLTNSQLKSQAT